MGVLGMVGLLRGCVLCLVLSAGSAVASVITPVIEPTGLPSVFGGPGPGGTVITRSVGFNPPVTTGGGVTLRPPVTITRGHGWPAVRAGMKGLITRNPGAALATAGLGTLLASVEWVMTEGTLTRPNPMAGATQCYWADFGSQGIGVDCVYQSSTDACRALYRKAGINISRGSGALTSGMCYYYPSPSGTTVVEGEWERVEVDPSTPNAPRLAVTPADIDDLVNGINDPSIPLGAAPSIFDNIPGSFDYPDTFTFDGPASMPGNPSSTTTTDHVTGDITIIENNPTYNFDYSTNPLSITTTTNNTTITWQNGQKQNTSTNTDASPNPIVMPGGGGGPTTPTDCAFMPTVCAFIEWVKQPFTSPEPDLSQFINDEDFTKSHTITGDAVCPAPMVLSTSKGDFEFSWQPGCDLALLLKPFFLLASLIACIYITLGMGRSD